MPISFAPFVMHGCETRKKDIYLWNTLKVVFWGVLLHVCTDCYYCERKRRTNAKLFCVLSKPPTRTN